MMSGFLLDTNIISELITPKPEPKVVRWIERTKEELLYLSVLTLGEIRKGIAMLPQASRRIQLEAWLATELQLRFTNRMLPIEEAVADRFGRLAGEAQVRKKPIPVIDGLLAATAIHYNLILVTRNADNVSQTGVSVFNPWKEKEDSDAMRDSFLLQPAIEIEEEI